MIASDPLFSLVLATVDTSDADIDRFFQSVIVQDYPGVEVVVVDQNDDGRLERLLARWKERLRVMHARSPRGLSRARNVGLAAVSGAIIAFPDDDCWYPPGLLNAVEARLADQPDCAALCGRVVDESGAPAAGKFDRAAGPVTRANVWNRGVSVSMFVRTAAVRCIGAFDECLGAGAATRWQSGEETDYLVRILDAGFAVRYDPAIEVGHPGTTFRGAAARHKAYRYGMGMGKVLQKHAYPFSFVAASWLRTAGGGTRALLAGDHALARFAAALLAGRVHGYLAARRGAGRS